MIAFIVIVLRTEPVKETHFRLIWILSHVRRMSSCGSDLRWTPIRPFDLCVSQENVVERGLKMWKRQKNGSPVNPLKVTFLGEPGLDTGALRKEFLSAMVAGIEKRLFEGDGEKGKMPKYLLNDLDDELFRAAGEIFAVSIAQGGPAPRYLQKWCYDFLVSGNLSADDVYDTTHSPLIQAIEEADDMTAHIQDIVDCGYTGKIDMEHKDSILRTI
ncbi:G2/M phase-specific E3 ubiquitin-protein ligase-like isoform X1 [Pagrus major]|uniref:G2/M phase-specific E3 ubiquitin-protein ligase-like isoform X1 n=2 Tax=Pagrus major TaxID=143350 RepID=UPI003CC8C144